MNSFTKVPAQNQNQPSGEVLMNVIVKQKPDGKVIGIVAGIPELQVEANDRTTVLAQLQQLLEKHLAGAEIVPLSVKLPQSQQKNPWLEIAGIFKDDPQFDQMLEAIERYRRELDSQMEEYYSQVDAQKETE